MPAPIEDHPSDPHQVQLQAVGKAFDALLLTLYRLTNRHNDLKQHSEDVFKQVNTPLCSLFHSLPPFPTLLPQSHMTRN
jgi:Lon protease-like protein